MKIIYFNKIKFFNKRFFYQSGDYMTMKNLLKFQKDRQKNGLMERNN